MLRTVPKTIGLIAGNGQYPLIFARKVREQGHRLVAIGVKGETEQELESLVDRMHWISAANLKDLLEFMKGEGATDLVMAGEIKHKRLFSGLRPDVVWSFILSTVKDRKADTLLGAIAKFLAKEGFHLLDSRTFLKDLLPRKGVLTRKCPEADHLKDIQFGFDLAKKVSAFDFGQSVAVKERAVVAVEAMEGTDEMIRRAARIAGPGVVIVKVSKARQDVRFDVPCIGPGTVAALAEARSGPLVIQAGETLILDKERMLREADEKGLVITAI